VADLIERQIEMVAAHANFGNSSLSAVFSTRVANLVCRPVP
jgi:hypothetical protein